MTASQSDKAARFRKLHEGPGAFLMPNPWDAGSARLLAGLGFAALATSSGAEAGVLGRRDGMVTRDQALAPARPDLAAVRQVCAGLGKPFSFMAGIKGKSFTTAELAAAGARRISVATSFYRAAMDGLLRAAREVKDQGSFGYVDSSMTTAELNAF